jgi:hypothetical protein
MAADNPFEVPIGKDLSFFIKTQGTRLLFDSFSAVANHIQCQQIESGEIDLFSVDITTPVNNRFDGEEIDTTFTHYCKLPDQTNTAHSNDRCFLKEIRAVGVFAKKAYILSSENPAFADGDSHESSVYRDIKMKTSLPWLDKRPLHRCTQDVQNNHLLCNCEGGLSHWSTLDAILSSTNAIGLCNDDNVKIVLKIEFNPHDFIPWRNEVGELVFSPPVESDFSKGTGNCISATVQLSIVKLDKFCGIPGLFVDVLILTIGDIYYCPLSHPTQGPHICHKMDCDIIKTDGATKCVLTGIAMPDRNGDWCFDKHKFKFSESDIKESLHIQGWFNSLYGIMSKHSQGASRDDLRDMTSESFSNAMREIKTIDQLNKYQINTRNMSAQRSMSEKKKRALIREKLMEIGTEEARRMATTGHFSDYEEYEREALFTVMKILQFGEKTTRAMMIDMEKRTNIVANLGNGSNALGYKQKKLTFITEGQDPTKNRKRITTEHRMRIEHQPSKKTTGMMIQYSGQNGSTALVMTGETGGDDDIFDEEIVEIDKSDIAKVKDAMIQGLAQTALRFWALIRVRTRLGRDFPNYFNFHTFIYAFLYLLRDGYDLNTAMAGVGDRIVFFPGDMFLRHALPENMSDLNTLGYQNHLRRDAKFVYKNIKRAIQEEIVDNGVSHVDLDPHVNRDLDFSIDSKEFPPYIFVSLQSRKGN